MANTKSIPVSFRLTESEHAAIVRISGEDAAKSLSETVKALVLEGLAGRLAGEKDSQLAAQMAELRKVLLDTQESQLANFIFCIREGYKQADPAPLRRASHSTASKWRAAYELPGAAEPDGKAAP